MIIRQAVALLRSRLPVTMRPGLSPNADQASAVLRAQPLSDAHPSARTFLHACSGPLPPPHRLRGSRRRPLVQPAAGRGWIIDQCSCTASCRKTTAAAATATQQTVDTASRPRTELPKNFDPASEEQLYAWCGVLSEFAEAYGDFQYCQLPVMANESVYS